MAALKEPVKIFIVQALACRDTPQQVVDHVKQEFDLVISRSQCQSYDPTKYSGRNLSEKFVKLFNETREKFDDGLIDIPIANKHYRMRQYDKLLNKAKNIPMALRIMEQAAKDSGGLFTNRKEITGANGGPVETVQSQTTVDDYLKAREKALDEY
nr:DUF2280 domain-containing protein [uncultured Acinetobacter sp.]